MYLPKSSQTLAGAMVEPGLVTLLMPKFPGSTGTSWGPGILQSQPLPLRVCGARDSPVLGSLSPGEAAAFQSYGWSNTGCRRTWSQMLCSPLASPPTQQSVVQWGFLEHPSSEGPIPGRRLWCPAPDRLPARPSTGHPHPPQPLQALRPLRSGSEVSPAPPEAQLHGEHGIGAPGVL